MYTNIMDLALNAGETKVIPHSLTKKLFTDMSYPWLIIVEPFPHDSTKGAHIELVSWDKNSITLRNTEAVTVPIMLYMDQMHSVSTAHKVSSEYTPQIPPIVAPNFGTLPSSETLSTDGTRVRSPMYINLKDTIGVAFNPDSVIVRYVNPGLGHTDIDGSGIWGAGDDTNNGEDKLHPWLNIQTAINRQPENCGIYIIKVDETVNHCARSYAIQSYIAGANGQIVLSGNQSAFLEVGQHVRITGSDNPINNNSYTILSIVVAGNTTITFNESIAAATAGVGTFYGVGADEEKIQMQDDGKASPVIISGTPKHVQDNLINAYTIKTATAGSPILVVNGDASGLSLSQPVEIRGSTGNDGYWSVDPAISPVYDPVNDDTTITLSAPLPDGTADGTFYDGQYRNYDAAYEEGWSSLICKFDRQISCYDDIKTDWINIFKSAFFTTYMWVKILEYEVIDPVNYIYKLKLGGSANYSIATGGFGIYRFVGSSRLRPGTILRGYNNPDYSLLRIAGNYKKVILCNIGLGDELNSTYKVYALSSFQANINFLGMFNVFNDFMGNDQCDTKMIFTNTLPYTKVPEIQNIINDNSINILFDYSNQNFNSLYCTNILNFKFYKLNFYGLYNNSGTLAFDDSTEPTGNNWISDFYVRNAKIEFWDGSYIMEYRATLGRGFSLINKLKINCKLSLRNWMVDLTLCPTYKNSFYGDAISLYDGLVGRIYQCNSELYAVHPISFPEDASLCSHYMRLIKESSFLSESNIYTIKSSGTLGDSFLIENGSKFFCLGDITTNRDCADYDLDHNYIFKVIDSEIDVGDVNSTIEAEGASACLQGGFYLENSKAIFDSFLLNHERDISSSTFGQNGNGMFVMNGDSSLIFRNTISGRLHESLLLTREAVGGSPLIANQFAMFRALDSFKITSVGYLAFAGDNSAGAASGHYFYFDGEGSFNLYGLVVLEAEEVNAVQGFGAKLIPIEILNGGKGYLSNGVACQVFGGAELGLYTRFLKLMFNCSLVTASLDLRAGSETITTPEAYNLSDVDVVYDSSLIVTTNSSDIKNYMDCRYFDTWTAYGNRYASLYVLNSEFINLPRIDFTLEKGGRVLNFLNSSIKTGGLRYRGNHLGAAVIPTIGVTPYPTDVYVNSNSDVCMFINSIDFVSGDYGDYSALAQAYLNSYDYVHGPIVIDDQSNIVIECEPTEATTPGYNLFVATAYSPGNFAVALRNASVITGKILHTPDTRAIWYWACLTDDDPTTYQDFWLGSVTAVASVAEWPGGRNGKWNDVNADSVGLAGEPGTCELVLVSLPVGNPD